MAWEYKTLFLHPAELAEIAKAGLEQWEAFAAAPIGGISDFWVVWLKRFHAEMAQAHIEAAINHMEAATEPQEKRRGRPPKE